jgi:hypothetical protein
MGVLVVFPFLWSNLPIFSGNIASLLVESGMPSIPARSKLVGGANLRTELPLCCWWLWWLVLVVRCRAAAGEGTDDVGVAVVVCNSNSSLASSSRASVSSSSPAHSLISLQNGSQASVFGNWAWTDFSVAIGAVLLRFWICPLHQSRDFSV